MRQTGSSSSLSLLRLLFALFKILFCPLQQIRPSSFLGARPESWTSPDPFPDSPDPSTAPPKQRETSHRHCQRFGTGFQGQSSSTSSVNLSLLLEPAMWKRPQGPIHGCARTGQRKELSCSPQVHCLGLCLTRARARGLSQTLGRPGALSAALLLWGGDGFSRDLVPGAGLEVELPLHPLLGNRRKGWHGNFF